MEVLIDAPKCPYAGQDGRNTHRNPSGYLVLIKIFHRLINEWFNGHKAMRTGLSGWHFGHPRSAKRHSQQSLEIPVVSSIKRLFDKEL